MKILLFCTEAHIPDNPGSYYKDTIRAPLIKLGHEVIIFAFRVEMERLGRKGMHRRLKEIIEREKPEIFFHWLGEDELDADFADYVHNNTASTSAILLGGDDGSFDRSVERAGHYDFALTTCREEYEELKRRSNSNVILTQRGCNPDICYPVPGEKRCDVVFVGRPHKGRPELLTFLKQRGIDIRVWGEGWELFQQLRDIAHGPLPRFKVIEALGFSRIALGMAGSPADNGTPCIKGRMFDYAACKAFQLTHYDKRIADYFGDGKEIVLYRNKEDLFEKIGYYLEHEEERERIAEAGYRRALKDHTWEKRFECIFREMAQRQPRGKLPLRSPEEGAGKIADVVLTEKSPKASIISYVYNYGNYLQELIPSVLGQSFEDLEFLILDDGSTDNTKEIVGNYLGDRRLRYVYQENIGKQNRFDELIRRALELTSGELINIVGGDDIFMPNKLERQVKEFIQDTSLDIVFSDLYFIDDKGDSIPGDFKCEASYTFSKLTLPRTLFSVNLIAHPTVLMKRGCIDTMGGFERWYCGDFHFWLKSAPFLNFKFIDEKLIKYRIHEKGASTGNINRDITVSETNAMLQKMRARYTIVDLYPEILLCRDKDRALYSAYIGCGNTHMMARVPQPFLAAIEYQRALEHNPKGVEAINNIGIAFFMLGDRKKFGEFFRYLKEHGGGIEGIKHNISLMEKVEAGKECQLNFALLHELPPNREFVEASQAIKKMPRSTGLFQLQQVCSKPLKAEEKREAIYKEVEGLSARGMHKEAASVFEGLLDLYPDDSVIFNDLGVLYYYAGEVGSAVGCIEKSIRISPANKEAMKNLAGIYLETGKTERAIAFYEEIMQSDPNDLEVLFTLGDICIETGKSDEAATLYGRVLSLEPDNRRAKESMARNELSRSTLRGIVRIEGG